MLPVFLGLFLNASYLFIHNTTLVGAHKRFCNGSSGSLVIKWSQLPLQASRYFFHILGCAVMLYLVAYNLFFPVQEIPSSYDDALGAYDPVKDELPRYRISARSTITGHWSTLAITTVSMYYSAWTWTETILSHRQHFRALTSKQQHQRRAWLRAGLSLILFTALALVFLTTNPTSKRLEDLGPIVTEKQQPQTERTMFGEWKQRDTQPMRY